MKVVIIGAGPAGLVTCKTLVDAATPDFPFDPVILEQEDDIGGTFRYRSYQNGALVSSKQLTCFSDFRVSLEHPDYLTLNGYVQYLRDYCAYFDVERRVQLRCKVIRVSREPGGGHCVSYVRRLADNSGWETNPTMIHAQLLAVCTGLHVVPGIPTIPGIEHVLEPKRDGVPIPQNSKIPRSVYHSVLYKSREQLSGRRLMILGTGETGMDLAYESAKAGAKEVVLCTRNGFISFPKIFNDFTVLGHRFKSDRPIPVDTLVTNLGETAYVHPWVERSHLRWFISDTVIKWLLWLITGTGSGCNQWVGEVEEGRFGRAYGFLNKSFKALPYLNRPYRKRSAFLNWFAHYNEPLEDTPPQTEFVVDLAPFPTHFLPSGKAVFPMSKRKDALRMAERDFYPDTVIYATGYEGNINFLDEGYPNPSVTDMRNVVRTGDEDVAFIGLLRPSFGAIPPVAEMQAMFWASLLKGQVKQPLSPPSYKLLVKETARLKYGVDHSSYLSTLARDMGTAPGLWELWWQYGTQVLICYSFGATWLPFYRLTGQYRWSGAPKIVKTELWEAITRRGVWGNIIVGIIPMSFYLTINAVAYVLGLIWLIVGGKVISRPSKDAKAMAMPLKREKGMSNGGM